MKLILPLLCLVFLNAACKSAPVATESPAPDAPVAKDYHSVVEAHTKFFRKYDGFYEVFRGHATLITPESQSAILHQKADYLQWDSRKLSSEQEKAQQEMSAQTKIFLQFFAPQTEYNDFAKYNTIWHVYLEIDGRRFEGKAKKAKGKPIEFMAIFPSYDSFSTPYELTFNISTSDVIRHEAKLVLASTLGEGIFTFPPGN